MTSLFYDKLDLFYLQHLFYYTVASFALTLSTLGVARFVHKIYSTPYL